MKHQILPFWLMYSLGVALAAPYSFNSTLDPQKIASNQLASWQETLNEQLAKVLQARNAAVNGTTATTDCTADNIIYRQEWGSMLVRERRDYIDAVKCLMNLPPLSSPDKVPGARSRYDDFTAMHITYAPIIHHSGLFLVWHRYYTWLYEKALRDECVYKGGQPYWDWTLNWDDLTKSPVFDGSPYSMGSNGKVIPHGPVNDTALGSTRLLNPGTGGGCIEAGPFANLTINLGPVALLPAGPNNGMGYNPRCLHRDFSAEWNNNSKPTDVVDLITGSTDITSFDVKLEALKGLHAAGHFGVGGMMADQYASSSDPIFWLHHSMVDRVWTMWQSHDPSVRPYQTGRTVTAHNNPPSANATLDTIMPFGILGTPQKLGDLVSTIDGPFCYQYI
ncbi:uncharacterized protein SETTUDRAFT_162242 [Exserohilum turcica Et28A]|uniref:Tyrosinase copper-binding domain-containing protein n=1 Tax=Exserohilum turcicum (strain 28A) TaxID=671987 RepID=R0KFE9_EXST2|nr:uncharacterized protein SETTUDRAFT_162242 [Exserohilum turcica Et28A]EOA91548.1 hypothetical protein SETTUDRAFT_162242 [Exserohilum turcica Et28A]